MPPRYEILSPLGRGGMAEVHLARSHGAAGFAKRLVLKRLLPEHAGDAEARRMFLDEARLAAMLDHPNVAQVFDFGEADGRWFIAMEYVHGVSTETVLERARGPVPLEHALAIVCGAAAGLHHAHERVDDRGEPLGIVHRDVTPGNVLVTFEGCVKVVDFGIARANTGGARTRPGTIRGTTAYMSPEQCRGDAVDRRSDVFSLGILLYELTCGVRLFTGESELAVMNRITAGEIPAPSERVAGYPGELEAIVLRALKAQRAARHPTARALAADLEAFAEARGLRLSTDGLGRYLRELAGDQGAEDRAERVTRPVGTAAGTPATATPAGTPAPTPPRRSRGRWIAMAGAAAALVAAAVIAWPALRQRRAQPARSERFDEIFRLAQAGEHEIAREQARAYLAERPGDPDALVLLALTDWWIGGDQQSFANALAARISPAQRALISGVSLMSRGLHVEAQGYLEQASRDHPGRPEIQYALGEAYFHGGRQEDGVRTLIVAFETDPRWAMALRHVIEARLAEGRPDDLRRHATRLRAHDPDGAAALEAKVASAERRYADAAALVRAALAASPRSAPLWSELAAALILDGDLAAAENAAHQAFTLSPVDEREWHGFSLWAELRLYHGDLDGFRRLVGPKNSRVAALADALWCGDCPQARSWRGRLTGSSSLLLAADRTIAAVLGEDPRGQGLPADVTAYTEGLRAERAGDLAAAARRYDEALAAPSTGELRMLLAHRRAALRRSAGDAAGAAAACDEVLHPRRYLPYRAVLLPDCLLWTAEAAPDPAARRDLLHRLTTAWTGSFAHPSVVAARAAVAP